MEESKAIDYEKIHGTTPSELGQLYKSAVLDMPKTGAPAPVIEQMQFQTLREFLFRLLLQRAFDPNNETDRAVLNAITADEYMGRWQGVFNHSSFDPENNYEYWEFLGDKVLKHVFANYLGKKFPNLRSPKILTIMDNHYMGYEYQAKMSEELNIGEMIISKNAVTRKDHEDVFEAIFGMLDHLVNKVYNNQGYAYCFKLLSSVLDERGVEIIKDQDARSRFKIKLDLLTKTTNFVRPVIETRFSTNSAGGQIVIVTLTQTINGNRRIIYQESGDADDKSKILRNVSEKGIQFLDSQGYNGNALNKLSRTLDERNAELKAELAIYDKIVEALNSNMVRSQRMITGYFFEEKKSLSGMPQIGFNLVVRDTNGEESNQEMKIGTGATEIEAKLDAIREFNKGYPSIQ